jgi:hypothetical protein
VSDTRVRVDRRPDPVCPYCKAAVVAGHVWLCPDCGAAHHAACRDEHGACASCLVARTVEAPAEKDAPEDERLALAPRRRELERLGFTIVEETGDTLVAEHPRFRLWPLALAIKHRVLVRRVRGRLDEAGFAREMARAQEAFSLREAVVRVVVVLADEVDPAVRGVVEDGVTIPGLMRLGVPFPAVLEGATGTGSYFRRTRFVGAAAYPAKRHLARRLLFPQVAPDDAERRATRAIYLGIFALCGVVALIVAALVSLALRAPF